MPRLLRCAFRSPQTGFRPPVLHPLFRAGGGEQGEKREAAKHDGRSKNQERLAPVHVVLTTSVDLNPLGPVPFFLESPPDLLHDSTGSFRCLGRSCFHWRRFLLCTAMSAHARGPGGIVLPADLSLWSLIANAVIGRHRSPLETGKFQSQWSQSRAIHRTRLSHLKEQRLGGLLKRWTLEDHHGIGSLTGTEAAAAYPRVCDGQLLGRRPA